MPGVAGQPDRRCRAGVVVGQPEAPRGCERRNMLVSAWRGEERLDRRFIARPGRAQHHQSPRVDCHSVSAATAAVSARRMRGPRRTGWAQAIARSRARSASEKPPSGPIRIAQGPPRSFVASAAAKRDGCPMRAPRAPRRRTGSAAPAGQSSSSAVELLRRLDRRHEGAAALLGGLDRMGLQPVRPSPARHW